MTFRKNFNSAMLFALVGTHALFATTISVLGPGSSAAFSASVGGSVEVAVDASSYTDLYAWQFDLTWNPAILSLMGISEGTALPSAGTTFFIPGTIDNAAGSATANADTLVGAVLGASGSKGALAYFDFKAIGRGITTIGASNIALLDSSVNAIAADTESATVTVTPPASASPEPSAFELALLTCSAFLALWTRRKERTHGPQTEKSAID